MIRVILTLPRVTVQDCERVLRVLGYHPAPHARTLRDGARERVVMRAAHPADPHATAQLTIDRQD